MSTFTDELARLQGVLSGSLVERLKSEHYRAVADAVHAVNQRSDELKQTLHERDTEIGLNTTRIRNLQRDLAVSTERERDLREALNRAAAREPNTLGAQATRELNRIQEDIRTADAQLDSFLGRHGDPDEI
jgi:Mg2+ and Co2+ transporter CorA